MTTDTKMAETAVDLTVIAATDRPTRCTEIDERWQQYFGEQYDWGQPKSQPANRSSVLPHACENYPLLYRRWWREHVRPTARLASVYRQGNIMERETRFLLEHDLRFELRRSGMSQDWPAYQITGSIDTEIKINGEWVLAEIKSCHPNVYAQINAVKDFLGMKFHVFRRYPGQLLTYQWLGNQERALMLLCNKNNSEIKGLWQYLDDYEDRGEWLVQRAERINAALADGTPHLTQISDPDICPECEFAARCAPPLSFSPPLISRNLAFIAMLNRRGQLAAASKEYKKADEAVKNALNRVVWQDPDHPEIPPTRALLAGAWTVDRSVRKDGVPVFHIRSSEDPKEEEDD